MPVEVEIEEIRESLVDFCSRRYPVLVGALGLYVGDRGVAEELAQETLLRVCRDWDHVRRCDSPDAWSLKVAFNLARSRFRRLAAARRAVARLEGRVAAAGDGPDRATAVAVRQAVLGLPDRQRRAVVLRYFADLPVREVAGVLGCPEGTVKTLTYQAIQALRAAGLEVDGDG